MDSIISKRFGIVYIAKWLYYVRLFPFINYAYKNDCRSVTQKQGVITCLPKPNTNKHLLKNWRPISLLNVVYKMMSSVIANRFKMVLDKVISTDQKGFISGRFIGENIRLIDNKISRV